MGSRRRKRARGVHEFGGGDMKVRTGSCGSTSSFCYSRFDCKYSAVGGARGGSGDRQSTGAGARLGISYGGVSRRPLLHPASASGFRPAPPPTTG
jgi:hypothetical protein